MPPALQPYFGNITSKEARNPVIGTEKISRQEYFQIMSLEEGGEGTVHRLLLRFIVIKREINAAATPIPRFEPPPRVGMGAPERVGAKTRGSVLFTCRGGRGSWQSDRAGGSRANEERRCD